jgi:hypothetical protein
MNSGRGYGKVAFGFAREMHEDADALSGLELLMALRQMIEETHHHWIEDNKRRNDILGKADWKSHEVDRAKIELPFIVNHCAKRILAQALSEIQVGRT